MVETESNRFKYKACLQAENNSDDYQLELKERPPNPGSHLGEMVSLLDSAKVFKKDEAWMLKYSALEEKMES